MLPSFTWFSFSLPPLAPRLIQERLGKHLGSPLFVCVSFQLYSSARISHDDFSLHRNFLKPWPVDLSLENIRPDVRMKPTNGCTVILALLPVPPKAQNVKGKGSTKLLRHLRTRSKNILAESFRLIFKTMERPARKGRKMFCSDEAV